MAQGDDITWNNEVKNYFTQMEMGCMQQHGIDLSSYTDVKTYANAILSRVSLQPGDSGFMPAGGQRWEQAQLDRFKEWIAAGSPEN